MLVAMSLRGVGVGRTDLNHKKPFLIAILEGVCWHFLSDNSPW